MTSNYLLKRSDLILAYSGLAFKMYAHVYARCIVLYY